jgi:hypothetical protein
MVANQTPPGCYYVGDILELQPAEHLLWHPYGVYLTVKPCQFRHFACFSPCHVPLLAVAYISIETTVESTPAITREVPGSILGPWDGYPVWSFSWFSPHVMVEWLIICFVFERSRIQIPARTPAILTEVFHGFPQYLQANAGIVL